MKKVKKFSLPEQANKLIYPWELWESGEIFEVTMADLKKMGSKVANMQTFRATLYCRCSGKYKVEFRHRGDVCQFQLIPRK